MTPIHYQQRRRVAAAAGQQEDIAFFWIGVFHQREGEQRAHYPPRHPPCTASTLMHYRKMQLSMMKKVYIHLG
jgi:hypothetical protein